MEPLGEASGHDDIRPLLLQHAAVAAGVMPGQELRTRVLMMRW